jgi:hypothetical protein
LRKAHRRLWRDQRGQVLPLLAVVMLALIGLGVLVFELAFSTSLASTAQTAADAAALAAEKEVVRELNTPVVGPGGELLPPVINPIAVRQAAADYASRNGGNLMDMQIIPALTGDDVLVTVQSKQALGHGSLDAGAAAVREARASTDPFASGSQALPVSNDASVSAGPRFIPHGGQFGFFPSPSANYSIGQEPEIAGRLDALGKAEHLRLVGISGWRSPGHSVEVGGSADDPHTCGAASDTPGVEGVSEQTLAQFGLTRPFPTIPKEADHIQLAGTTGSVCLTGAMGGGALPSLGNPNPHLVPLTGGGQGSLVSFVSLSASAGWTIPWPVVNCESGGRNMPPNSATASGYYQITNGTWNGFGGYPEAWLAPKSVQDAKAAQLIATRGLEPWTSSEPCWGPVLGLHV